MLGDLLSVTAALNSIAKELKTLNENIAKLVELKTGEASNK